MHMHSPYPQKCFEGWFIVLSTHTMCDPSYCSRSTHLGQLGAFWSGTLTYFRGVLVRRFQELYVVCERGWVLQFTRNLLCFYTDSN